MKRHLLKQLVESYRLSFPLSRKILIPLLLSLVFLSGIQAIAQPPLLPVVTVRFANPQYICPPTNTYCLDVEFKANTEGLELYGINIRFFYDDNILEYLSMGDFRQGYWSPFDPEIQTWGDPGSRAFFGFSGPVEWINGDVQKKSGLPIVYLPTSGWVKLFKICFIVDDPDALKIDKFCPSVVWDLIENPPASGDGGGYVSESDNGVVMTVVTSYPFSAPTVENVVQFNWVYAATSNSVGHPFQTDCIPTTCGEEIPLSNWALFLAIGLMIVATVFIYRRRISG